MVGLYPDPPDDRMAFDRDGSIGFTLPNGAASVSVLTQAQLNLLNSETNPVNVGGGNTHIGLIFPEPRDITHIWYQHSAATVFFAAYSNDTTNGLDGTWTTVGTNYPTGLQTKEALRTQIRQLSAPMLGVKAMRVWTTFLSGGNYAGQNGPMHVYGEPSTATLDKNLNLWDETLDQKIAHTLFELGDVTIGDTHSRSFRVKNHSATLTANNVVVDASALTDTTPAYAAAWEFSTDAGATWATSVTIPSIAPGAISGVVQARILINSTISLWWQRITALATTWT